MLTAVTAKAEIAQCEKKLASVLKAGLPKHERLRIGHQGGNFEETVSHGPGLWYATFLEDDAEFVRYWNGFGIGKRDKGAQLIAVEINVPVTGYSAQVSGLFARDDSSGDYVLLHRGKIGGGRKGIGKTAFRSWSRHSWVEVAGPDNVRDEAILVARLDSTDIVDQIKIFVSEIAVFKKEAASGTLSRKPSNATSKRTFNPEFHGRKKGHRSGVIEYETFHGLVVDALGRMLTDANKDERRNIFNNVGIDLGVEIAGRLRQIYEVKSSADPQVIYTGLGQLMMHALLGTHVEKTLVLPKGELSQKLREGLKSLDIDILEYKIKKGRVKFSG